MVFSPGRLNLTWQYFQEVLLIWIALLSREKARLCLKDELWGPKKKEKKEKGRKWVPSSTLALILQHRCKEHLLCSLLSWIFCLFFFFLISPLLFLLNIHWSRKPGIPRWMSQLSSCGFFHAISDPVTICVQSGVQEEGWSVPALQKRVVKEEGQVRASSSGWHWGELEVLPCFF